MTWYELTNAGCPEDLMDYTVRIADAGLDVDARLVTTAQTLPSPFGGILRARVRLDTMDDLRILMDAVRRNVIVTRSGEVEVYDYSLEGEDL